jgi:hypothetical protein
VLPRAVCVDPIAAPLQLSFDAPPPVAHYALVCVILAEGAGARASQGDAGRVTVLASGVASPGRPDTWHAFDGWGAPTPVADIDARLASREVQHGACALVFSLV